MKKPVAEDFITKTPEGSKQRSVSWKEYAKFQESYIVYLEGILEGKELKLPKEQLPIECEKCKYFETKLSYIRTKLIEAVSLIGTKSK